MSHATELFLAAPREWVDTGSERIAYRRFGSGPPLVLVHGFPLSALTWRHVLPELAKHRTCYALDLPGLGETEWSDATDFSFPGQGRTLFRFVDRLGLDRYDLLAHDTGGTFARFLALVDPSRVGRLVLVNTEMPHHRPPFIPLYQALMHVPGILAVFERLLRSRRFLRSSAGFGGCFVDLSTLDGEFHTHFVAPLLAERRRMEGLRRYLIGAKWAPVDALADEHRRLAMPVLLLWGADDPTFPVALARTMVPQFPDARIVEIPRTRLLPHEEKPREVAHEVLAFLT